MAKISHLDVGDGCRFVTPAEAARPAHLTPTSIRLRIAAGELTVNDDRMLDLQDPQVIANLKRKRAPGGGRPKKVTRKSSLVIVRHGARGHGGARNRPLPKTDYVHQLRRIADDVRFLRGLA